MSHPNHTHKCVTLEVKCVRQVPEPVHFIFLVVSVYAAFHRAPELQLLHKTTVGSKSKRAMPHIISVAVDAATGMHI